jgi:hypothetical protein
MGRSLRGGELCLLMLLGALAGCGDDEEAAPQCTKLDGVCVGVPAAALCGGNSCTDGISCGSVLAVANDAELDNAIASAAAGDCIALAPGRYKGVDVPAGVSLLGRSASEVKIAALTLGTGARVRGLQAEGGIAIGASTDVVVDAVRMQGGPNGLSCGAGASATVTRSEIVASEVYGLVARDAASLTLERSIVRQAGGGGLWVQCDAGCDCVAKPSVSLDHVLFEENAFVAISLQGTRATLGHVNMLDTHRRDSDFALGGGLALTHCSELTYAKLMIRAAASGTDTPNTGYGMLIDSSSAGPLGSGLEEKGIIIVNGKRGLWIQGTGAPPQEPEQPVVLDGLEVDGASVVGVGFDLGAQGIIIVNGKVGRTSAFNGPTLHRDDEGMVSLGAASLGIGLVWKAASAVTIESLELSASATHSFIIDGPVGAGSAVNSIALSGGDEDKGIVQQFVQPAEATPTTGANVPAIQQSAQPITDVPIEVEVPATLP